MEYYSAIKKEETAICDNFDRPGEYVLSEIDQRQILNYFTYMWDKIIKNKNRPINIENELMVAKGESDGRNLKGSKPTNIKKNHSLVLVLKLSY